MKYLIIATLFFCHTAYAQSFDCEKAESDVEKMICNDRQLSRLDDNMAEVYKICMETLQDKEKRDFIVSQRQWLKTRDACTSNDCVQESYWARLKEIRPISLNSAFLIYQSRLATDKEDSFLIHDSTFCLYNASQCTIKLSELKNFPGLREAFIKTFELSESTGTGDINYLIRTRAVLNFYLLLAQGKSSGYEAINTPFCEIVPQLPSSMLGSFTGDVDTSDNVSIGDYFGKKDCSDNRSYSNDIGYYFKELTRGNFTSSDREEVLFMQLHDRGGTLKAISAHHAYYDKESKSWKHIPVKRYEGFDIL